jgi:hypothetical protein
VPRLLVLYEYSFSKREKIRLTERNVILRSNVSLDKRISVSIQPPYKSIVYRKKERETGIEEAEQ